MSSKYFDHCSIHDCNNDATKFCKLTPIVYKKAKEKGTFKYFQYLKESQELCFKHYLDIVEANQNQKKSKKMNIVVL
ncbi:3979_t:CDS:1, partial [Dentiscutata heterogama]